MILGLVAPSGGGKTTVCDHLTGEHGFLRIHVAEPIKDGFRAIFSCGPEYCERPLIEQPAGFLGGVTPRHFLELFGKCVRELAPMAIPLMLIERLEQLRVDDTGARIVVDGIRLQPEADAVRRLGGFIVRMEGKSPDPSKPFDLSQTEVEADFTLHWTKRLSDLRGEIDQVIAQIGGQQSAQRSLANHPDRNAQSASWAWDWRA